MSTKLCRQAIEARLYGWASTRSPALPLAWQNVAYTPTTGQTYLRGTLLPADTASNDLKGDHRGYRGVYQVDVCAPINAGPGAAEGIAAELDALFPVNLRITVSGLAVQITGPASVGPAAQVDTHFILPVSIPYRADAI